MKHNTKIIVHQIIIWRTNCVISPYDIIEDTEKKFGASWQSLDVKEVGRLTIIFETITGYCSDLSGIIYFINLLTCFSLKIFNK